MTQFRQYISTAFADQLHGMVNDVRGDKTTAGPKILEDLSAFHSMLRKLDSEEIGSDLHGAQGTAWSVYQRLTEFLSHETSKR